MSLPALEDHRVNRANWLRAAVLGANDGIISTASLVVGVAAASSTLPEIITAGVAGMIAGALSMAAGEYVSVSSQADIEKADLEREKKELAEQPEFETEELAQIYVQRGLDTKLAREVAIQMMNKDALTAHLRDELGINEITTPRPVQAGLASAAAFSIGASLPIASVLLAPGNALVPTVFVASWLSLWLLGGVSAWLAGSNAWKPTLRIAFWGAFAMAVTAGVGRLIGAVV